MAALTTTTVAAAAAIGLALSAVGSAVAASASSGPAPRGGGGNPKASVSAGMAKFRENKVEESIEDFDAALEASPSMRPYLWQRGLSLYYVKQYEEGARQFRDDVAVNPSDTEESIWAFLCEAQMFGAEKARQQFLEVGRDSRPVMRAAYECFRTGSAPDSILAAAAPAMQIGGHDAFYSQLYVGLWYESHGNPEAAKTAIMAAISTPYARQSGDYMAALGRVHALRRGWM